MTKEAVTQQIEAIIASKSAERIWEYYDLDLSAFSEDEIVMLEIRLFEEDWHYEHENLALSFQHYRNPLAVDILFKNAFREELDIQDYKPLARKCVWALADIGTDKAKAYIEKMAVCGDPIIEAFAQKRLNKWELELPRKGPGKRQLRPQKQEKSMQTTSEISSIFHTTLERAFKSPMLCDITKVHTGYGITPKVTHCTEDETWGQVGGSRKVFMAKTATFKGGESSLDKVLEREENKYWKIEISDFKTWSMGFEKFQGEWFTTELEAGKILVRYRYTMFSNSILFYPLHWLFTKTVWRNYMKHVLENIRKLTVEEAPYLQQ